MQRKIIKLGTATLVASLPSQWIKANNLKQGDLLTVVENGHEVVLSTRKEAKARTSRIKIHSPKEFMGRLIHTPYRFGCDKLEVSFDDPAVMPLIRKALDQLLGFEIVDQTDRSCVIEMVAKGLEEESDKILRRLLLILKSMVEDLKRGIDAGDEALLEDVASREATTNKLAYFCLRVLNTRVGEPARSHYMSILLFSLEMLGDHLRDLALWAKIGTARLPKKERETVLKSVDAVSKSFNEFNNLFSKPSQEGLLRARNTLRGVRREALSNVDSSGSGPLWSLFSVMDHLLLYFEEENN